MICRSWNFTESIEISRISIQSIRLSFVLDHRQLPQFWTPQPWVASRLGPGRLDISGFKWLQMIPIFWGGFKKEKHHFFAKSLSERNSRASKKFSVSYGFLIFEEGAFSESQWVNGKCFAQVDMENGSCPTFHLCPCAPPLAPCLPSAITCSTGFLVLEVTS